MLLWRYPVTGILTRSPINIKDDLLRSFSTYTWPGFSKATNDFKGLNFEVPNFRHLNHKGTWFSRYAEHLSCKMRSLLKLSVSRWAPKTRHSKLMVVFENVGPYLHCLLWGIFCMCARRYVGIESFPVDLTWELHFLYNQSNWSEYWEGQIYILQAVVQDVQCGTWLFGARILWTVRVLQGLHWPITPD